MESKCGLLLEFSECGSLASGRRLQGIAEDGPE